MRRSSLTSLIALFTFSLCGASVAEAAYSAMLSGTTATFTGDNASDTIIFEQVGGLMKHNRFTAGDTGFENDFDFDSTTDGPQTLAAASSSIVVVNTGDGNDTVIVGTAAVPAIDVAAQFTFDGAGGMPWCLSSRRTWSMASGARDRACNGCVTGMRSLGRPAI